MGPPLPLRCQELFGFQAAHEAELELLREAQGSGFHVAVPRDVHRVTKSHHLGITVLHRDACLEGQPVRICQRDCSDS